MQFRCIIRYNIFSGFYREYAIIVYKHKHNIIYELYLSYFIDLFIYTYTYILSI
jgi:hypothetical protein